MTARPGTRSSHRSRRVRAAGVGLVFIGAFLIATGVLSRAYAYERLAVMPGDAVADAVATTAADEPATYFDLAQLKEVTGQLVNRTRVLGDVRAADDATRETGEDVVVWSSYSCTNPANEQNCLTDRFALSATLDVTAFGAHSSEVVPWSGARHETGGETDDDPMINGYVYKLPFNVQQRDYSYWDADVEEPVALTYEGTGSVQGLRVYKFTKVVEPTEVGTIDLPGSLIGSSEQTVTGKRIYSSRTSMTIEPESGAAVTTTSTLDSYVTVNGKRVLTIIDGTLTVDDSTVASTVKDYKATSAQLRALRVWIPWGGGGLGVACLLLGAVLLSPRRRRSSARPDTESGDAETSRQAALIS